MTKNAFAELGLSPALVNALIAKGFTEPTPIQAAVIPLLLNGQGDIFGQAQTGTGKTAAFALPLIERIVPNGKPQAIILTPTRELALQVCKEIESLRGSKKLVVAPVYGGQGMREQLRALKGAVDIIVGTPGRIIDHLDRKTLNLNQIRFLVLDEADEMLNMGFSEDVEKILIQTPINRQLLLFSATLPKSLERMVQRYAKDPHYVRMKAHVKTDSLTEQWYVDVKEPEKIAVLTKLIDVATDFYGVIFCRTKVEVDSVSMALNKAGYASAGIHGDFKQSERERILHQFRKRNIMILVATDVAARGLDVKELTHVVNFSLPNTPESYVHRVGRTGRAGQKGTAITLVSRREFRNFSFIQRIARVDIKRMDIPSVKAIRNIQLEKMQAQVLSVVNDCHEGHIHLAKRLLTQAEPLQIVAALVKQHFGDRALLALEPARS